MTPPSLSLSPGERLSNLGDSLLEFSKLIGQETDLVRKEALRDLYFKADVSSQSLSNLTLSCVENLCNSYGDAIQLSIFEASYPVWRLDPTNAKKSFDDFHEALQDAKAPVIELILTKNVLLRQIFGTEQFEEERFIFLYGDRASACLSSSFSDLENSFWKSAAKSHVVLFICDDEILSTGKYLSVCGKSQFLEWEEFISGLNGDSSLPLDPVIMHSDATSKLHWSNENLKFLTPLHFTVKHSIITSSNEASSKIKRAISIQYCLLGILFTADRTSQNEGQHISLYQRGKTPVTIQWPAVWDTSSSERTGLTYEKCASQFASLIKWIYEPRWTTDRLSLVQLHVTDELRARKPDTTFEALLDALERLEDDLLTRWKDFMDGKLDGYSEQERKLEEDVAKTTQTLEEQIGAMTKGLGESGLAAAGTVGLAFFSAVLKDTTNLLVPAFCLVAYACYVFFFPYRLGLQLQQERFKSLIDEFDSRRKRFENRLTKEKVNDIILQSQISANQDRFNDWAKRAQQTYIFLMGASVLIGASLLIAHFFQPKKVADSAGNSSGIMQQTTATPKPTSTLLPTTQPSRIEPATIKPTLVAPSPIETP